MVERVRIYLMYVMTYTSFRLWFRKVFPGGSSAKPPVLTDTPLARIRAQLDAAANEEQEQED